MSLEFYETSNLSMFFSKSSGVQYIIIIIYFQTYLVGTEFPRNTC